jgi:hypothetical protein
MRARLAPLALAAALLALPAAAVELVMVDQPGCIYCARWEAEIAPAYANTPEGRFAPLRRVDIRAVEDEVEVARRVVFTPTFLVVEDGRELARMEGYSGDEFFWPLLEQMLRETADYEETPE